MKKIIILFLVLFAIPVYSVTRLYDRNAGDIIDADKDDAEFDNTNNAITTHEADNSAHGVTGNNVGTAGAQTLSGPKTLVSPIITTAPTAAGATWADLGTATIFAATSATLTNATVSVFSATTSTLTAATISNAAITNATISSLTGDTNVNSGGSLSFFSDVAGTLKAKIFAATGKFIGYFLKRGTYNLELVRATTTNAGDSLKVQCGGAACSVTNPGVVVMGGTTAGTLTAFIVTSDVTQLLTGAHWGIGTTGDITGALIRSLFINDNGTLRTCFAYLGGRETVLTTDTNATQTNIDLPEEILCNTAVSSATNTVLDWGYARGDFDDSGGAAPDLWAVQTGINDVVTGRNADGLWQPWNIIWTVGFSANPTTTFCGWSQNGRNIQIRYVINAYGTSNSISILASLPVTSRRVSYNAGMTKIKDNGTPTTSVGVVATPVGSGGVGIYPDGSLGLWTAANAKGGDLYFSYEVGPAASFIE